MDKINWIQVALGFLGGGAVGALIKQFFDSRRNRIQPIGYSIELKPFYNSQGINTQLINQITLNDGTNEYQFSNLYTGTIEIINTGLKDYPNFSFGINLPTGVYFIKNKSTSKDRHHITELTNEPTLTNQTDSFDINLKPFNRKDRYVFDVLLTDSNPNSNLSNDCITISTPMPVKLTKISTTGEAIISYMNRSFGSIVIEMITNIIRI